jgi:hypothetical protein
MAGMIMWWNLEKEVGHAERGGRRCSSRGCFDTDAMVGRPSPLSLSLSRSVLGRFNLFSLSSMKFIIYMAHMLELVVAAIRDCRIDFP